MYKKVYWNIHEDAKRYLSVSRSPPGPRGEIGAGVRNCKSRGGPRRAPTCSFATPYFPQVGEVMLKDASFPLSSQLASWQTAPLADSDEWTDHSNATVIVWSDE